MTIGTKRAVAAIALTAIVALAAILWAVARIGSPDRASTSVACAVQAAPGRTFHIDPQRGRSDGEGSAARPWRQLSEVAQAGLIAHETRSASRLDRVLARLAGRPPGARVNRRAVVTDNDTILLHDGDYGDVDLSGLVNRAFVTIAAAPGAHPRMTSLTMNSASHFIVRGIAITAPLREGGPHLLTARWLPRGAPADNLRFEAMDIGSGTAISAVSRGEWAKSGRSGATLTGDCLEISDSRFHDVRSGVTLYNVSRTRIASNLISGFSVDAIAFAGTDIAIAGNRILDHWQTGDAFHADCIQGQSGPGHPVFGPVRIERNLCIAQTRPRADPGASLQGITIFDGRWRDVTVRCNLLLTNAPHGIALYGVDGAAITGNVVLGSLPGPANWILAFPSKGPEYRPPTRNLIRGNIAMAYPNAAVAGPNPSGLVMSMLGASGDTEIVAGVTRGFSGVTLAENIVAADPAQIRRQLADPRLTPIQLRAPIAPISPEAAVERFPLPSGCPPIAPPASGSLRG